MECGHLEALWHYTLTNSLHTQTHTCMHAWLCFVQFFVSLQEQLWSTPQISPSDRCDVWFMETENRNSESLGPRQTFHRIQRGDEELVCFWHVWTSICNLIIDVLCPSLPRRTDTTVCLCMHSCALMKNTDYHIRRTVLFHFWIINVIPKFSRSWLENVFPDWNNKFPGLIVASVWAESLWSSGSAASLHLCWDEQSCLLLPLSNTRVPRSFSFPVSFWACGTAAAWTTAFLNDASSEGVWIFSGELSLTMFQISQGAFKLTSSDLFACTDFHICRVRAGDWLCPSWSAAWECKAAHDLQQWTQWNRR